MAEVDYQLALLLQHKFDQEKKIQADLQLAKSLQEQYENEVKKSEADLELAKSLQEHYQKEFEVECPSQNLVYNNKASKLKDATKSLTDPSWEVIDPTPDIHALFIAFNQRFFWNTLGAVTVNWSKRMTTCAGICSYQGAGGMCTITLSEPLLKLRPRKDLVETLLHEMIHAHLFVTNNNRDRDGHGPEFHKHMHRINSEAGTNITVYHNFHDEVRLYQQHWWRCDGPCQSWKPYFGMVRRAMNRPPGPNDRWWGEHSRNCGGNFVKVKEPEKSVKPGNSKSVADPKNTSDIRNFIPTTKVSDMSKQVSLNNSKTKPTSSNIQTIPNNGNTKKVSNPIPKAGNIFGFTNSNASPKSGSGIRGAVKNTSNTIIINKKPISNIEANMQKTNAGSSLSAKKAPHPPTRALSEQEYSTVRNHWLNKFPDGTSKKRTTSSHSGQPVEKEPKLSGSSLVQCPACFNKIEDADMNVHLDTCLSKSNLQECIICQEKISSSEFQNHVSKCTEKAFSDDVFEEPKETVICVICRKETTKLNPHNCESEKKCEVCGKSVLAKDYPGHLEECLNCMYNNIEAKFSGGAEDMVDCLACNRKIKKSELNNHLEDCMSLSQIFDDENEPEVLAENKNDQYNCPFCMELFKEQDMSQHINDCFGIKSSSHIFE